MTRAVVDQTMPRIVCLCGSTRFWREFQRQSLLETMAGRIVLSIGAASGTDDGHFGSLPREVYDRLKQQLDALHLRKVELADEVLVLNVGGYVGESTAREVAHAYQLSKYVRWLEYGPDDLPRIDDNGLERLQTAQQRRKSSDSLTTP